MAKYIVALDIEHQYGVWKHSAHHTILGVECIELDGDEFFSVCKHFREKGYILLEVSDSPQVILEQVREDIKEQEKKQAERSEKEQARMSEARERRKQKAEALRLKKEQQQLEAARKLLREKGEL